MANTTNYNWETPDDTDLVKDGAAAIRTLGNSIDTTTKNLNPETTTGDIAYRSATANTNTRLPIGSAGQVLTVAAGVPSWATPTDQTPLTTKGDVFTFSTVDARLGVGANGTVLTADSAETTGLKWVAPTSGSMTLLDSGTLSGASVTTASLSASYQDLRIVFRNIRPATDASFFIFRFNADSNTRYSYSNGNTGVMTFGETYMSFNPAIDNGASTATAVLIVPDYANTATWKQCYWNTLTNNSTTPTSGDINRGTGVYNQTSAISSLTFLMSTGNFTSGDYYVYGVK
jgi:hypothetical protein